MRMALYLIIVFEILAICYSIHFEILQKISIPFEIEGKLGHSYRIDGEILFAFRVGYLVLMYIIVIFSILRYWIIYLFFRKNKLIDCVEDRSLLLKGMNLMLFRTVTEPIVLIISNSIIADLKEQDIIYKDI